MRVVELLIRAAGFPTGHDDVPWTPPITDTLLVPGVVVATLVTLLLVSYKLHRRSQSH